MKSIFRLGINLGAAALLFSQASFAVSIFSDNFDNPPYVTGLDVTLDSSIHKFIKTTGSLDVVNSSFGTNCAAPSGNNCIDINGTYSGANPPGPAIIQSARTITLRAGNTYVLTFYVAGSGRDPASVLQFGITSVEPNKASYRIFNAANNTDLVAATTLTKNFTDPWTQVSVTLPSVLANTNIVLELNGRVQTDNDQIGLLFDDINIECTSGNNSCLQDAPLAGTPEPASMALIGAGLALVGLRLRKR